MSVNYHSYASYTRHSHSVKLQRRWHSLQHMKKPTGDPNKPSDVEEAQKIQEEIMTASHQGQVGNTSYVEAHAQYEIGSLTANGKRKLSQASSDSFAEKKSGGTRFFKALEEMTAKTEVLEEERASMQTRSSTVASSLRRSLRSTGPGATMKR